jgi:anti-sigma factor RsiW
LIRDHLRYMPGREQIVSASAQEVERWLQGQVDFPVRVPELPEAALEEGRICSVAGRRAALLHYRRRPEGVLISFFVTQAPQKLGEQETVSLVKTAHLGCNAALWYRHGLAYSVVAALNDSTLEQIADSVRQQQP